MELSAGIYDAETIMDEVRKAEGGNANPSTIDSYKHARAFAKGLEEGNNECSELT